MAAASRSFPGPHMLPAALPMVVPLAGLLLTLLAFQDLPLLGTLFGAVVCGAVAGLLARHTREAARAALLAGTGAAGALLLLVGLAPSALRASSLSAAVLLSQAIVVGLVPAAAAALVAYVAETNRPDLPAGPQPPAPGAPFVIARPPPRPPSAGSPRRPSDKVGPARGRR